MRIAWSYLFSYRYCLYISNNFNEKQNKYSKPVWILIIGITNMKLYEIMNKWENQSFDIIMYMILRVCWMTRRQAWQGCACPASADVCLFDVGRTYIHHTWLGVYKSWGKVNILCPTWSCSWMKQVGTRVTESKMYMTEIPCRAALLDALSLGRRGRGAAWLHRKHLQLWGNWTPPQPQPWLTLINIHAWISCRRRKCSCDQNTPVRSD